MRLEITSAPSGKHFNKVAGFEMLWKIVEDWFLKTCCQFVNVRPQLFSNYRAELT